MLVKKAVSDATGTVVFEKLLADHTYTIKETNVPKGFVDPADTYQIHLDASGQPQDMINLTTKQVVKDIVNDVYRKDIVLKKSVRMIRQRCFQMLCMDYIASLL